MNNFQKLIVLLMVVTGALNTISASLQLARPARGMVKEPAPNNGNYPYFEHYYVQTLFMMLGESMCMLVYVINKYVRHRADPSAADGDALEMNSLILWPAAALDLLATSLGYMGLAFLKDPGFFQMLRVSPMIFTGLLSIPILKQRLRWFNWVGMLVVCLGIVIKVLPKVLPNALSDAQKLGTCVHEFNATEGDNFNLLTPFETDEPEGLSKSEEFGYGITLVLVGEFFHAVQFVYEEKFITKYKLAPLKVVGIEGVCGTLTLAVLLWPMYYIPVPQSLGGASLGPYGRLEDAIDGFMQIFDGADGGWLLCWTLGNMCSIAVFNFAGISVTKELSATTRAVLDQIRIILITIAFTVPLGVFICRLQQPFHFTVVIGLLVLVLGVFIYNDVIIMPLIRRYILKSEVDQENVEKEKTEEGVDAV